ncbi:MAG TPA: hypothetical protein VM509_13680 [Planctomycetota bacterium]|nr:hypothetical protein [Planctomycetota bacterium]
MIASLRPLVFLPLISASALAQGAGAPVSPQEPVPQQSGIAWKDLIGDSARFKVYGFVRLDAQSDDSRPNNTQTIGWILSEDSVGPATVIAGGRNKEDLTIHPRLTRIGIDVDGGKIADLGEAKVNGKIEIDFFNNGLAGQSESREALRMRHAYLKLAWTNWSVLFGQTSDVISPIYPVVNADLVMWGAGNLGDRRPQIRPEFVMPFGGNKLIFQGEIGLTGADDNQDLDAAGTAGAGFRDGETSGLPTLQARLAYSFLISGQKAEVGVWGHQAWEEPDTSFAGENEFESKAYGVDVTLPVYEDRVTLKGEAWKGEDLDDVRGGIFQGINTTTGDEIESRGGFVELGVKITTHTSLFAGWSNDNPENSDLNANGRAENQIWYGAARWNYKPVAFGLEYLDWTTKYIGLDDGTDKRVVAFVAFNF